ALVVVFTVGACASTSESDLQGDSQDIVVARGPTFAEFRTAMDDAKKRVENGECLTVVSDAQRVTLTATEGPKSAHVAVPSTAKITLSKKNSRATYEIEGVGDVVVTSAEDAFESVAITSLTPKASANCEVDF